MGEGGWHVLGRFGCQDEGLVLITGESLCGHY